MTSKNAWNIFEQTGNVEAYLLYQQLKAEEKQRQTPPEPPIGEPYFKD